LVQEVDQQIADAKSAISAEETKPIHDETSDQNPDYQWVLAELTKAQADLSGLKARAAAAIPLQGSITERLGVSTKAWSLNRTFCRTPRHKRRITFFMNGSAKKRASVMPRQGWNP